MAPLDVLDAVYIGAFVLIAHVGSLLSPPDTFINWDIVPFSYCKSCNIWSDGHIGYENISANTYVLMNY